LKSSFPNTKGFSARNLWDMRRFYERYQHNEFLRQLVAEIPWGHNLLIINKIKNDAEATFYIQATAEYGWSRNVLLNQIKSKAMRINEIYQKINSIILKWHFQNIYQNRHPKR
jgi:predicted nuclease of restriction endonuclease-like (RecB) superfamily